MFDLSFRVMIALLSIEVIMTFLFTYQMLYMNVCRKNGFGVKVGRIIISPVEFMKVMSYSYYFTYGGSLLLK